ncbi:cysteine protease RD19B [Hirschfeldia incana]|nr:cysteine protease RD19B [Hirschfeldia incana]
MGHLRVISSISLLLVFVSVQGDDIVIRLVVNGSESEPKVMSWEDHFSQFKRRYGKVYSSLEEDQNRFYIFRSNFMRATRHQRMDPFARYGVTQFSDLTHSEFRRKHLGVKGAYTFSQHGDQAPRILDTKNLPDDFDWRVRGAVTPVKNQGPCGSSWSFSTTGALEGAHFLATGKLVSLSEQQLVDCDHKCDQEVEGLCDSGCSGGLMNIAFEYTFETGGLMREEDYQYYTGGTTDGDGICKFDKSKIVASVSNFSVVSSNEDQIAANLVKSGPLAVAINSAYMQSCIGGVSCPYRCSKSLNHGVLLVGYGSAGSRSKEKPYWIIKNSWGETWGENGFFKLCKGRNI